VPAKGDVSDYIAAGHTRAELIALAKAAALWTPPTTACRRSGHAPSAAATRQPIVTFLNTVEPEAIDWLWTGRLARGKYTLLAGEPGIGKTYLATDCAARISRGGRWVDGTLAPAGKVLYLTAEDGIADTIRPRIDALGGDPSKIAVLEAFGETDGSRRSLSLAKDLECWRQRSAASSRCW
jgi:hypothetical protein